VAPPHRQLEPRIRAHLTQLDPGWLSYRRRPALSPVEAAGTGIPARRPGPPLPRQVVVPQEVTASGQGSCRLRVGRIKALGIAQRFQCILKLAEAELRLALAGRGRPCGGRHAESLPPHLTIGKSGGDHALRAAAESLAARLPSRRPPQRSP
jgi:hypothetical protein